MHILNKNNVLRYHNRKVHYYRGRLTLTLFTLACSRKARSQNLHPIWFPHCPTANKSNCVFFKKYDHISKHLLV